MIYIYTIVRVVHNGYMCINGCINVYMYVINPCTPLWSYTRIYRSVAQPTKEMLVLEVWYVRMQQIAQP